MDIEVGAWNKLPHYAAIGDQQAFYLWVNEDGHGDSSNWIRGQEAMRLWFDLKHTKRRADKIVKIKRLWLEYHK